jgi:hypothetical protein
MMMMMILMVMIMTTTTMMMNMIILRKKMTKIVTKTNTTIFNLAPKQLYDLEYIHIRNLFYNNSIFLQLTVARMAVHKSKNNNA